VTIPEAAYVQLRRRPPEDEQGNVGNMDRILINVLYVNKQEFCASSWRQKSYTRMQHGQTIIKKKNITKFTLLLSVIVPEQKKNAFSYINEHTMAPQVDFIC
jgi:hypothetical protein